MEVRLRRYGFEEEQLWSESKERNRPSTTLAPVFELSLQKAERKERGRIEDAKGTGIQHQQLIHHTAFAGEIDTSRQGI